MKKESDLKSIWRGFKNTFKRPLPKFKDKKSISKLQQSLNQKHYVNIDKYLTIARYMVKDLYSSYPDEKQNYNMFNENIHILKKYFPLNEKYNYSLKTDFIKTIDILDQYHQRLLKEEIDVNINFFLDPLRDLVVSLKNIFMNVFISRSYENSYDDPKIYIATFLNLLTFLKESNKNLILILNISLYEKELKDLIFKYVEFKDIENIKINIDYKRIHVYYIIENINKYLNINLSKKYKPIQDKIIQITTDINRINIEDIYDNEDDQNLESILNRHLENINEIEPLPDSENENLLNHIQNEDMNNININENNVLYFISILIDLISNSAISKEIAETIKKIIKHYEQKYPEELSKNNSSINDNEIKEIGFSDNSTEENVAQRLNYNITINENTINYFIKKLENIQKELKKAIDNGLGNKIIDKTKTMFMYIDHTLTTVSSFVTMITEHYPKFPSVNDLYSIFVIPLITLKNECESTINQIENSKKKPPNRIDQFSRTLNDHIRETKTSFEEISKGKYEILNPQLKGLNERTKNRA